MRSKTSFFNKTMFAKAMARWWPLWGAYFALWLLVMPVAMLSNRYAYLNGIYIGQGQVYDLAIYGGVIGGFCMGALAAMAVWSFLYTSRSAHGMACLPVRREGQYLSALLAGFVPVLCANAVIFLLTLLAELSLGRVYFAPLLTWFGVVTLTYLFFYAFATFCAQLTGNIIVLPLVYGVLNFTVWAVRELVIAVLSAFVYGMSYSSTGLGFLTYLSPPMGYLNAAMYGGAGLNTRPVTELTADGVYKVVGYTFHGWGVLLAYAAAGLVLMLLALLLFRRRRMETAGDVVAVKPLKPVFRWCMALGCGLVFGMLMYAILLSGSAMQKRAVFLGLLIFMLIGAFIGWFAAEMLIKKSFRVFKRNSWAGLGICFAVIVALMLCMRLDLFGYETRVPAPDRVQYVYLSVNGESASLTEPENIARVAALHGDIIANKSLHESGWRGYARGEGFRIYSCFLTYHLENGGNVTRRYDLVYLAEGHADLELAQELLNLPEAVRNRKAIGGEYDAFGVHTPIYYDYDRDNITYAHVSVAMTGDECARLGGYASAEDYVLYELSGWDRYSLEHMSPSEWKEALNSAILDHTVGADLYEKYGLYDRDWNMADLDLDPGDMYFMYTLYLTPAEAAELYNTCCLPDIDDGALGRVSILDDGRYENEFYNARIEIEAREERTTDYESGGYGPAMATDYDTVRFSSTPTVDSRRTNAWLRAHGVALHTNGETTNTWTGESIINREPTPLG